MYWASRTVALAADAPGNVEAPLSEHELLVFLVQVLLLVGVARLLGALLKRLGQPAVVGELLAGVVLGPSLFGLVLPGAHEWVFLADPVVSSATFALAWLGVVFLLVVMGFETDLAIIARFKNVALAVAAGSLFAPMLVTGGLGYFLADQFSGTALPAPWLFASFFALALSVSALPVVGKILTDLGVMRRDFAQVTLAAAMAKDAVGWLVLAVLSGVAVGGVQLGQIGISFGGLAVFVVAMLTVGRWALDRVYRSSLARGAGIVLGLGIGSEAHADLAAARQRSTAPQADYCRSATARGNHDELAPANCPACGKAAGPQARFHRTGERALLAENSSAQGHG